MEPSELQRPRDHRSGADYEPRSRGSDDSPGGDWSRDASALRLRELTDYVYQMITMPADR